MIESIIASFSTYYGADWLSLIAGFAGTYLLTRKNPWGFVLMSIGMAFAMMTAIIANQYGFIVANIVQIFMLMKAFKVWKPEERAATA